MIKAWSNPRDIEAKVRRYWDSGRILTARLKGENLFPLSISIAHPDAGDLLDRFQDVQLWLKDIDNGSKASKGFGYDIVWTESNHRQIGRNRIASSVIISSEEDSLKLIGKLSETRRFDASVSATLAAFPNLRDWMERKPLNVIENADKWERIISVLEWIRKNPRSGIYLRQMDIPGIDTKFIEGCKGLLAELLEILFQSEKNEGAIPSLESFETRFGLRSKPHLIRFRILDDRYFIHGLSDIAAPLEQVAALTLSAKRIFITENDINGLAFPDLPESLVIFGLGYGIESLSRIPWLQNKDIHYWGDIDTHGFAILDRLRLFLPHTHSLLMDRATLMEHKVLWVQESTPSRANPVRLNREEHSLFEDLIFDRLGPRVRLEQERIAFEWVSGAIANLV